MWSRQCQLKSGVMLDSFRPTQATFGGQTICLWRQLGAALGATLPANLATILGPCPDETILGPWGAILDWIY